MQTFAKPTRQSEALKCKTQNTEYRIQNTRPLPLLLVWRREYKVQTRATVCIVCDSLYSVFCILYSVFCILCSSESTKNSTPRPLPGADLARVCILYSVFCILYFVFCFVFSNGGSGSSGRELASADGREFDHRAGGIQWSPQAQCDANRAATEPQKV